MPPLSDLRARLDALPLDRAPLRRAGLLTALLVVLLVVGKMFGPGRAADERPAARHDLRATTEEVSAPRSSSLWTGGRVLAVVFLAVGGGLAFVLHRRSGGAVATSSAALDVLETHSLGPGQSLRLVGCGDEVLLLSVGSEGAHLLRHWPRASFDRDAVSFADALATAQSDADPLPAADVALALPPPDVSVPVAEPMASPMAEAPPEPVPAPPAPPPTVSASTPAVPPAPAAPALRQFQVGHA